MTEHPSAFQPAALAIVITALCVAAAALSSALTQSLWPFVLFVTGIGMVLFAHWSEDDR